MGITVPRMIRAVSPLVNRRWEAALEDAIDAEIAAAAVVNSPTAQLLNGAVSNLPRPIALANTTALTTQVMTSVALPVRAGKVITSLTFVSATTAAGTPTNWWFALYNPAGALVAQTADQTTTAWAANTAKTLALSAPHTVTTAGVYYAAIMVKATTVPTLAGVSAVHVVGNGALVTGGKVLSQTSGSALTATAPATIATPTTVVGIPLVIAS